MSQDPTHQQPTQQAQACAGMPRTGAVLTASAVLFLAFDGTAKIIQVAPVMEACQKMGISRGWRWASASC